MPYAFQNITFNASSSYDIDGFITNYTWDFDGNGIIDAITDNPVIIYSYSNDGIYNVTLTVYDNDGFNSTITKQITILNNPPVANFSFVPINPKTNENITFNASSSYDIDGFITNYTWNFGDGSIAYGKIVQHSYSKDGIYNVTLTIYDDDGSIATVTKKVNVRAIIANFTWTPLDAVSKEQIQFIDLSQGATQWQWNFGDGSYAYEQNPIHIYVIGNYYNVTLTIFNGSINASISKLVKVNHKVELYKNENNVVNYVAWLSDATTASQLAVLIGNDIMPKGSVISKWNVTKGAFDSYIVGISPPSYDFVIEPYDVVVLRVASAGNFIENVIKLEDRVVNLYKNEDNVVNHIAWSCLYSTNASQLAVLIGNDIMPKGSVISKWNVTKGAFDSYIVGISPPSYDFVIEPGDCVVLRVASSGSFIMEVMK